MGTSFPGGLDTFPRPDPTDLLGDTGVELDLVIDNLSDAIEAIEAKVGVDGSAVAASLDFHKNDLAIHVKDSGISAEATGPNTYPLGISQTYSVVTGNGWPVNGTVVTFKAETNSVFQLLRGHAGVSYVRSANGGVWIAWDRLSTQAELTTHAASADHDGRYYTEAEVDGLLDAVKEAMYPVGSIYQNASDGTNPATLLGFGTWAALGPGRMLVGIDAGDADFDVAGETGGSKTQFFTTDIPSFNTANNADISGNILANGSNNNKPTNTHNHSVNPPATASDTKSIMNPYVVVYRWQRTA